MANNKYERLFDQFPPVTTEEWEAVINADLKGADYQKKLVWRTAEGFNVRPYYRAEDLAGLKFLGAVAGQFPFVRGIKNGNGWRIYQQICVADPAEANRTALKAIEGGAESLGFYLENNLTTADTETLLKGLDPTVTELVFNYSTGLRSAVDRVMTWAARFDKEHVRICFCIDPLLQHLSLRGAFVCAEQGQECFRTLAAFIRKYEEFKHVRFVGVEGRLFGDSGSTIVEELGFTLAAGHEYLANLIEQGIDPSRAARSIRFSVSITSNYFMEIAKLRAARMLWANIVKAYDPEYRCAEKMFIHAVTSAWNQTVYDSYVNMLRGTTEAMSAAIGGIHSMQVLPFDLPYERPDEMADRIARNVQLLLKNESHFDNVTDPAGGSYYIENLTESIAEEAWKLFKEVEAAGGYIKAFESGMITDRVKASADKKNKEVATRRITLLGTNQYPNFGEKAAKVPEKCACKAEESSLPHLTPYRGAEAFERMREKLDLGKKAPSAFMLTCGSLAMARARAQFSCNFFACAGIHVIDNTFFHSVEEGAKAALESKAEIVVVCSSDDDYPTVVPQVAKIIGDKAITVVAGAPACADELKAQGITHFISIRDNVLDTLQAYLQELGIK